MEEKLRTETLVKIAHDRLYPPITNHSYLVLRRRRQILSAWIGGIDGKELSVLDIGGRYQPYRPLLGDRIKQYVAIDVIQTPLVDVIGRGEQLPFRGDAFDLVIATGVFEFFPEPRAAADEIHRVLRPGGHLLVSVASIAPRADDREHWRYLPAGLRFALASFSKVDIIPEVTSIGGFFRLTAWTSNVFAKYSLVRRIFNYTLVPGLNVIGLALESAGLTQNDQVSGALSALAQK